MPDTAATTIDRGSKITIGTAAAVFVMTLSGLLKLSSSLSDLNHKVDVAMADRYSLTQASENALRMAMENPGMRVPDPRRPGEVIVVKIGGTASAK